MSALEAGRLYMAKVEGSPERLLLVEWGGWANDADGNVWNPDCITDARPLIVLDMEFPLEVASLLRRNNFTATAHQIEAQTKPARIEEPGLWGVVRDCNGTDWSRYGTNQLTTLEWQSGAGYRRNWDHIIDPTLIREGLS